MARQLYTLAEQIVFCHPFSMEPTNEPIQSPLGSGHLHPKYVLNVSNTANTYVNFEKSIQ